MRSAGPAEEGLRDPRHLRDQGPGVSGGSDRIHKGPPIWWRWIASRSSSVPIVWQFRAPYILGLLHVQSLGLNCEQNRGTREGPGLTMGGFSDTCLRPCIQWNWSLGAWRHHTRGPVVDPRCGFQYISKLTYPLVMGFDSRSP